MSLEKLNKILQADIRPRTKRKALQSYIKMLDKAINETEGKEQQALEYMKLQAEEEIKKYPETKLESSYVCTEKVKEFKKQLKKTNKE